MERNMSFDTGELTGIAVHLAWAQLEIFADEVEKVQVMVAGDDNSVEDLRIEVRDGCLTVGQPQYGLSLNIMESRWLQVCVRVPSQWKGSVALSTLSGLLPGLHGRQAVELPKNPVRLIRRHTGEGPVLVGVRVGFDFLLGLHDRHGRAV